MTHSMAKEGKRGRQRKGTKFRAYLALTFTFTFSSFHVIHPMSFSACSSHSLSLGSFLSLHFHFNVLFVCIHAELQIMATPRIVCCSLCQPSDIENTNTQTDTHTFRNASLCREFTFIENTNNTVEYCTSRDLLWIAFE